MTTILNLLMVGAVCVIIVAIFFLQSSAGDARQTARVTGRGRAKSKATFAPPPPIAQARRRLRFDQRSAPHMPPPSHRPGDHRPHA